MCQRGRTAVPEQKRGRHVCVTRLRSSAMQTNKRLELFHGEHMRSPEKDDT